MLPIRLKPIAILVVLLSCLVQVSWAQRAPSPSEINNYTGLHKAAHENDLVTLEKLIADGATLDARDGYGRTPAHVAAFASNDEIIRALAEAGADMNALEKGIYDVVTIAAVANDPELVSLAIAVGNDPGQITSIY